MRRKSIKLFQNRRIGGAELAKRLVRFCDDDTIVLALPRGGVVVGYEIAISLHLKLSVFIVRKVGIPGREEFAMGAVTENGEVVLNSEMIESLSINSELLSECISVEKKEVERRLKLYRKNQALPNLKNKTVLVVDDGLATGLTAKAAVQGLKKYHPRKIVFASPIGASSTVYDLRKYADDVVCLATPFVLGAIGIWYGNFNQVSDNEVRKLLKYAQEIHRTPDSEERDYFKRRAGLN